MLSELGFAMPSLAYVIGAIVFGLAGLAAYYDGKRHGRPRERWLGVALMLYPMRSVRLGCSTSSASPCASASGSLAASPCRHRSTGEHFAGRRRRCKGGEKGSCGAPFRLIHGALRSFFWRSCASTRMRLRSHSQAIYSSTSVAQGSAVPCQTEGVEDAFSPTEALHTDKR
jgi:hypothetical protein